jgi:multiple sugar transport system substrate-binding protein
MLNGKRFLGRLSLLGFMLLVVGMVLGACGDNTATSTVAPAATTAAATTRAATAGAATTAAASATTAAATTAAASGAATTAAATTAASATTAAATTAAATTAASGAATTAAAGATTAASGTGAAAPAGTPDPSVSGTVRFAIAPSSPEEDKLVDQQLANFAQLYPNVKVTKEVIASDYDTKIKTAIAGNNAPDVFYVDSLIAPDYITDKVFEPLSSYLDKFKVNTQDFYPALLKAFTGTDNKVYLLPKDHNTLVMFYNKDMLQQAGITTPPTTWDELRAAAQKLKSSMPQDAAPIVADPDLARVLPWVYQAGGQMISDDGKSSKVTDPAFKDGLDAYYGLRRDGLSKKSSEVGADWAGDALSKGKAAIVFEGGWLIPVMAKTPNIKYAITPMPKGKQQGTLDFTVGYGVNSKAKDKDAAFALVNYLTSANGQSIITNAGLALPSRQSVAESFIQKYPDRKALLDSVSFSKPWQFGVGFGGFADKVNPELQKLFSGNQSEDDTIKKIDSLVKDSLANA